MNKLAAIASLILALGVASGAFGAHALRDSLSERDLGIWEKAVLYQLIHGMAALVCALIAPSRISPAVAKVITVLFLVSIVVFSGTLYLLVLLNQRWLGMITPLGGSGFIVSWLLLAFHLAKAPRQ